MPNKKLSY